MEPMNLEQTLSNLYARASHGVKLGLETQRALLEELGNPHEGLAFVHVAGTNGKGSVCAMIESVLRAAGHKTGLYTSPHLVRFNERIQVAGRAIADEELAVLIEAVTEADDRQAARPDGRPATFFEFTTALAFVHFRISATQIVVLETGLGGRLDATNAVMPRLSAITSIDLEHTRYLGDTLEAIAAEKAGIIKPGVPVVLGELPERALDTILKIAGERYAPVIRAGESVTVSRLQQTARGQKIKLESVNADYPPVLLPLLGRHQLANAALAVAALERVGEDEAFSWDSRALKRGLEAVCWPGRAQVLEEDPLVLLDVAHNPSAAAELAATLEELAGGRPVALVAGLLSDKDARGFFASLHPVVRACWLAVLPGERAMPMEAMKAAARSAGLEGVESDLETAQKLAKEWALAHGGLVCLAGSLVLAGEVLRKREDSSR